MSPALMLFLGLGVFLNGVLFHSICYAIMGGNEMPQWIEEWAPMISIVLALSGSIIVLVSAVLLVIGGA